MEGKSERGSTGAQVVKKGIDGGMTNTDEPRRVPELIDTNAVKWKEQLIYDLFDPDIATEIIAIPLSSQDTKDRMVWTNSRTGEYTMKTVYNKIREETTRPNSAVASSSYQAPRSPGAKIWQSHTMPKIKFFSIGCMSKCHSYQKKFIRTQIVPDPLCSICEQSLETVEHTLLLCPGTKKV